MVIIPHLPPLSRREWLLASGVGLASFALPRSPLTAGEWSGRLKKAVKYHMIKDDSLSVLDKFQMLKELGFDGVEIRTVDKVNQAPEEVLKARDETGLPI
ncbi:MAG: hypothetical protein KDA80_12510, partial [Planctomycetaceae bacterium]|nr:hypothetical protein [Planctomycetaceae bacterium]